ncbi:PAS domain-containing protein [Mucilaginibacter robiniae]|uniref:histidine kinase n=1 Tax=Mucilaginibacter robiniae TaxID=2728022 RepID=A0A7L5DY35_9SPHI|nr:ATP-binding protein [Mucilaginibacter robiniae]QJD96032.1 PAS domain-containing protein [Mucilaginibacter robiniae]
MSETSRSADETQRLAALQSYHILDTATERDFDELAELASAICQTPIVILGFLDGERHWFKAKKGIELTESPQRISFCRHAISEGSEIMVVENAGTDPRFADNPAARALNLQFYAGVPLTNAEGFALGTLCVFDHTARQLSASQETALKMLARQAMDKLELRKKIMELEAAHTQIAALNEQLLDQREELQSYNEEAAVINEELQSTNEELHSSNEELRVIQQELETSRQRLQLITDHITQLAWMAEPSGEIYWYNKRWYAYTGTTPEQMSGWGWQTVHHPDYVDWVTEKYKQCMQDGQSWEDTFPLLSAAGEYRWFLSRAVPFKDERGNILHWFGTNTDVTVQREEDQRKNDFISMVSHELKTPLTSLKGFLQILEGKARRQADTRATNMIDRGLRQVQRMTTLINGFLNVSRLESGQMHIDHTTFDMAGLIREVEEEMQSTIMTHHFAFDPVVNVEISADRDKISQVLQNFITNAVKYSPDQSTIYVGCRVLQNLVEVQIRDEGVGIAPQDQQYVFDRFYRVKNSYTHAVSGFGLYLCAEIIRRHGGQIGVNSKPGEGSIFWFSLPVTAG